MALRLQFQGLSRFSRLLMVASRRNNSSGDSDSSGAIRSAGGAWAQRESTAEELYFRKLEAEKLENLKKEVSKAHQEEIRVHEESINELQDQIKRHTEKINLYQKKLKDQK